MSDRRLIFITVMLVWSMRKMHKQGFKAVVFNFFSLRTSRLLKSAVWYSRATESKINSYLCLFVSLLKIMLKMRKDNRLKRHWYIWPICHLLNKDVFKILHFYFLTRRYFADRQNTLRGSALENHWFKV